MESSRVELKTDRVKSCRICSQRSPSVVLALPRLAQVSQMAKMAQVQVQVQVKVPLQVQVQVVESLQS